MHLFTTKCVNKLARSYSSLMSDLKFEPWTFNCIKLLEGKSLLSMMILPDKIDFLQRIHVVPPKNASVLFLDK